MNVKFDVTRSISKDFKVEANIDVISDEVNLHVQFYSNTHKPTKRYTSVMGVWMTLSVLKEEMSVDDFVKLDDVISKINSLVKII